MKKYLILLAVLIFAFNSEVLNIFYPQASADYDVFLEFYFTKDKVNEFLFALLFFIVFLATKKITRVFACFGFVISFSSMVDKALLGLFDYLITDVVVLIFATVLSYIVYNYEFRK
jgi:uncharacterized membrane protein